MGVQSTGQEMSYQEFIQNLNQSGIKTTSVREGKEANFADYGFALSDDLKQQITDSYDCEQDYELQKQIAGFFTGKNYINSHDFISSCKSIGLSVNVSYQKTSYIPDYKAGNFSNSIRNGSIAVYTVSDGMGGEIVIADANGNGALESEELFMNQILGDINYELGQITPIGVTSSSGASGANNPFGDSEEDEKVSQTDYNHEVEKFLNQGYSKEEATSKADANLKVSNMTYTGAVKAKEQEDKNEENIFSFL